MNIKNILCPVDFSTYSDAALAYASSLAKDSEAKLHIVFVYEEPFAYTDGFGGFVPPADLDQEQEILRTVKPSIEGVPFCQEFIVGIPTDSLVNYAKEHDIDLIVMGTHGRTGLTRLLMGSVAEIVVRRAPCPVVTIRQPEEKLAVTPA
jgi:nucleotide-binding universal stress UspA family protein